MFVFGWSLYVQFFLVWWKVELIKQKTAYLLYLYKPLGNTIYHPTHVGVGCSMQTYLMTTNKIYHSSPGETGGERRKQK